MTQRAYVPAVHLYGGTPGVDGLLKSLHSLWALAAPIILDFSQCRFLSAEAVGVLAALKLRRNALTWTTELDRDTIADNVWRQLKRWRLTEYFGEARHPWTDNALPLLVQTKLDYKSLVDYIDKYTVCGQNLPRMTDALLKEVRRSFLEVFRNVFQHAASPIGGLAIGQLYPRERRAQICVCDGGVGLVAKVQGAGFGVRSPLEAIQWALKRGHSTSPSPGGLGLFLLREFIKKNGGSFRVYANSACYSEEDGNPRFWQMAAPFPGTLIELCLVIRDDIVYKLADE